MDQLHIEELHIFLHSSTYYYYRINEMVFILHYIGNWIELCTLHAHSITVQFRQNRKGFSQSKCSHLKCISLYRPKTKILCFFLSLFAQSSEMYVILVLCAIIVTRKWYRQQSLSTHTLHTLNIKRDDKKYG